MKRIRIVWNVLGMMGLMLCLPAGMTWAQTPASKPPPEITVPRCEKAPVIDGVLDDACWKQGAEIRQFYIFGQKGKTTSDQRVCLAWDNQWLYIAAEIAHPMPRQIKPKVFDHDGSVNTDDSMEIFIDPGTDGKFYDHYLLNAANVRAEQRKFKTDSGDYSGDRRWDVPWRSATKITDKGWQAEVAIPMSELAAQGGMDRLRLNIAGSIWKPVIDPQGVEVYRDVTAFTWAPMAGSFHEPNHFGSMKGFDGIRMETAFLPNIQDAVAGTYVSTNGRYGYEIQVELRGFTPVTGAVDLAVADQPVTGAGTSVTQRVAVNGMDRRITNVFVPVSALGARSAVLTMTDTASGEIRQAVHLTDLSQLDLLSGVYPDRSFYTTEKEAVIRCAISLPDDALKGCSLQVRDAGNRMVGSLKTVNSRPELALDLTAVSNGSHRLIMDLLNPQGQAMTSQGFELIKLAPKPGFEWKTDRFNRVLLRDGKPFLPYGVWLPSTNEDLFKQAAEAGMNTVCQLVGSRWNTTNAAVYHALAAKYNLLVIESMESYATVNLIGLKDDPKFPDLVETNLPRMLAAADFLKSKPSLMAYFHFDEPGAEHQIVPGRKVYRRINELDGYHPWFVNFSSYIPDGDKWLDWSDILGTDPYWIPGGTAAQGVRSTINWMSKITAWTKRRADAVHHPIFIIPCEFWSGMRQRIQFPEEQLCQTYLALIHGANGLFYYSFPFPHRQSLETLKRVGDELRELGPIVTTPEITQSLNYKQCAFDPDKDQYPDIQARLFQRPEGGYVLLAANSRPYPVDVSYRIAGMKDEKVKRLFSSERHKMAGGVLEDHLKAYDTRAYILGAKAALAAPVEIAIETKAYPEKMDAKYAAGYPDSGRPGKKNIVQNPSLEAAAIPGWPDYMLWFKSDPRSSGPEYIGAANDPIAQDTKTAWHGKASLRIVSKAGNWRSSVYWWSGVWFTLVPREDAPAPYVFSAYMKADRDGVAARLTGFEPASDLSYMETPAAKAMPEFKLTTEWKRYTCAGLFKPVEFGPYHTFGVRLFGEGTVWIDGLQLEKGTEATEFEP